MKKNIIVFLHILIIGFVNAQDVQENPEKLTFNKGQKFINGNLSVSFSNGDVSGNNQIEDMNQFNTSINTSFAYAINNNLFLGIGLGYGHAQGESNRNNQGIINEGSFTNRAYQVFPYIRYYKGVGKKMSLFLQGEGRYSYTEGDQNIINSSSTKSIFVGIRPGFVYMLTNSLALESTIGSLGYLNSKLESQQNDGEGEFNTFSLSLNMSNIFFGMSYYF